MKLERSEAAFREARELLPGGVNSPVRAFDAVGGTPPFFVRGSGAWLEDLDGNRYLDFVGSWGPLILGHADPRVRAAIEAAVAGGWTFGAPTVGETELAAAIRRAFPVVEKVRLVNSGTEATSSALRLARGATGRDRVLKFAGCYHGHVDALLVQAGSGALTHGRPSSAGVPEGAVRDTAVAPYNDLGRAREILGQGDFAAVLLEPVAGNMGVVPPEPGFLAGLREACDQHGTLLLFDEVMTGFRVARGGATERYGVRPDLVCLGKVVGGGLPLGAYGGPVEHMDLVAPRGPVYQAGTLSGNPVAVAAGKATLAACAEEGVYERLESLGARLESGLARLAARHGLCVQRVGSMITLFFGPGPVRNLADASACDTRAFGRFHAGMLERGFYLPPSAFEAWFLSLAHTEDDLDATVQAASEALRHACG